MANPEQAQKEAQQKARALAAAYRKVFGVEGARSDAQAIVWADMRNRAYVERPIFVPDAKGELCPMRAAWADGARGYFLQISEMIRSTVEETKTVTVKK